MSPPQNSSGNKPFVKLARRSLMAGSGVATLSPRKPSTRSAPNLEQNSRKRLQFSSAPDSEWVSFYNELNQKMLDSKSLNYNKSEIYTLLTNPIADSILQVAASESIQQCVEWKQISQFLDTHFAAASQTEGWNDLKTRCEELIWLWRHKLTIITMISNARKL